MPTVKDIKVQPKSKLKKIKKLKLKRIAYSKRYKSEERKNLENIKSYLKHAAKVKVKEDKKVKVKKNKTPPTAYSKRYKSEERKNLGNIKSYFADLNNPYRNLNSLNDSEKETSEPVILADIQHLKGIETEENTTEAKH